MIRKQKIITLALALLLLLHGSTDSLSFASEDEVQRVQDNPVPEVGEDILAPSAPINLSYSVNDSSILTLTWDTSTDNIMVAGYEIYRDNTKVGDVTTNMYTEDLGSGFTSSECYVKAYDSSGNISGESDYITIDTNYINEKNPEPSIITSTGSAIVPVPRDLAYSIQPDNSVILLWSESDKKVAGYEVYRDGAVIGYTEVNNYINADTTAGFTYAYSVVACDESGNKSDKSESVTVDLTNIKDIDNSGTCKTDRYIVKYKSEEGSSKLKGYLKDEIKESFKAEHGQRRKNMEVITLNGKVKPEEFFSDMKGKNKNKYSDYLFDYEADIEYIQPDYEFTASSTDPYYDQQWGIENNGDLRNQTYSSSIDPSSEIINNGMGLPEDSNIDNHTNTDNDKGNNRDTYYADADVSDAWFQVKGEGVTVAVIDTGIDISQEDLVGNIWVNNLEIPNNQIDDDNNGYIDDYNGWNFVNRTNQVHNQDNYNDEWHGTHVSGIIAAQSDNNLGITGVAPEAKILPLKVFENGQAYTSDIIGAIEYAESVGVKIVNCSWGSTDDNPALKEVIENSNMLFVCAAGNSHNDLNSSPIYPASFDCDNIISVASINRDGMLSGFSNYGDGVIDIAAPGEDIVSTYPNNKYISASGTSMSAAFVSGEAALIKSLNVNIDTFGLKDRILGSSDRLSSLLGKVCNGYKINIENAILNKTYGEIIQIITDDFNTYSITNPTQQNDNTLFGAGTWDKFWDVGLLSRGIKATTLNDTLYYSGASGYQKRITKFYHMERCIRDVAEMNENHMDYGFSTANGKLYLIGGFYGQWWNTTQIIEINLSTGLATYKPNMLSERQYFAIASVDNIIYLIGGYIPGYYGPINTNTVIAYNPATNTWTQKASMLYPRRDASAAVINGKIYVAGGNGTNTMEMYDPITDTWTLKASMSTIRSKFGLTSLNGKLYAIGGYVTNPDNAMSSAEEYSPLTNSWSACPDMPSVRCNFGIASLDSSIYVFGGQIGNGDISDITRYQPYMPADDYWNDFTKAKSVSVGSETTGTINYQGDEDYFCFTSPETADYAIYTTGSMDSFGSIYHSNGAELSTNDGNLNFRIEIRLQAGQTYYIRVKHNNTGTGAYSLKVERFIKVPENVVASVSTNSITVTWNTVPDATGYDIEVDGAIISCGASLSYTHTGTSKDIAHSYRVRSKNSSVISAWSNYQFAAVQGSTWRLLQNSIPSVYNQGAASLNGNIYIAGGIRDNAITNKMYLYNPLTNTTTPKANMQTARSGLGVVEVNGKIYAIGGYNGSYLNTVEEYNPGTNSWISKASMPTARAYFGSIAYGGKIYIIGGYNGSSYLSTVEMYDPITNLWTVKTSMPTARQGLSLSVINNMIYAIGGNNSQILGTTEEYNTDSNTWAMKSNLPTARYALNTVSFNGSVYAIGGYSSSGYTNLVESYTPENNTWSNASTKLFKSNSSGLAVVNEDVYVIGGNSQYGPLSSVEILNSKPIEYIYNSYGRLEKIKYMGVLRYIYSYDNNGNLITIQSVK